MSKKTKRVLSQDFIPNTELCVDLKLLTRQTGRMDVGEYLGGTIKHDGEYHFTFIENDNKVCTHVHRNPIIYNGKCVNLHRKDDGTVFTRFTRPEFTTDFTFSDFCQQAAEELLAVACLVEKETGNH